MSLPKLRSNSQKLRLRLPNKKSEVSDTKRILEELYIQSKENNALTVDRIAKVELVLTSKLSDAQQNPHNIPSESTPTKGQDLMWEIENLYRQIHEKKHELLKFLPTCTQSGGECPFEDWQRVELNNEIAKLQEQLQSKRKEHRVWSREFMEAQGANIEDISALEADVKDLRERLATNGRRLEQTETDLLYSTQRLDAKDAELQHVGQQLQERSRTLTHALEKLDLADTEVKVQQKLLEEKDSHARAALNAADGKDAELDVVTKVMHDLEMDLLKAQRELDGKELRLREVGEELLKARDSLAHREADLGDARRAVGDSREKHEEWQQAASALQQKYDGIEDDFHRMQLEQLAIAKSKASMIFNHRSIIDQKDTYIFDLGQLLLDEYRKVSRLEEIVQNAQQHRDGSDLEQVLRRKKEQIRNLKEAISEFEKQGHQMRTKMGVLQGKVSSLNAKLKKQTKADVELRHLITETKDALYLALQNELAHEVHKPGEEKIRMHQSIQTSATKSPSLHHIDQEKEDSLLLVAIRGYLPRHTQTLAVELADMMSRGQAYFYGVVPEQFANKKFFHKFCMFSVNVWIFRSLVEFLPQWMKFMILFFFTTLGPMTLVVTKGEALTIFVSCFADSIILLTYL